MDIFLDDDKILRVNNTKFWVLRLIAGTPILYTRS